MTRSRSRTATRVVALMSAPLMALAALGGGGVPANAQASDTTVVVSAAPGVLFPECVDVPVSYTVNPPADFISWSIDLVIQRPDGTAGGNIWVSRGAPLSGVTTERFCPSSDMPGTYTVTGTYKFSAWVDSKYSSTTTPVAPFTIELRAPQLAITAKAMTRKPRAGKNQVVAVKVTDERPNGAFFGTGNADVRLQRLKGSRWVTVRGAKGYTKSNGALRLKFRNQWRGKTKYRATARVSDIGSVTTEFTVRSR